MFAKLYRFYFAALMCLPPCHKLFLSLVLNRTWGAGLFLLYFSCWHHTAQATPAPYSFANTSVQTLKARQGELSHELIITLPDSYSKEPNKRYPVLYYLDAYWDFPLVYATYGNLRYDKAIPEVILVGLSIAGDGYGAYRTRYFSIFSDPQKKTPTGQASQLYQHLTQDIIPSIDAQFRTLAQPTGRVLAGQSMGGLFTLYGLLQKSTPFSRFIAVNPAVAGSEAQLAQLEAARAEKSLNARLFISHGSREYGPFAEPIISYQQRLIARQYPGLALSTQELSGMGHTGGKGEAYAKGLLWALQDLAPNEKSSLQVDMEAEHKARQATN